MRSRRAGATSWGWVLIVLLVVADRGEVGSAGEELAVRYLVARGWRIVGRNVRFGRVGEIDIVAERGGVLAFVEVKTRRGLAFGRPGEAVTARKRARIRALARHYLMEAQVRPEAIRFDVMEILAGPRGSAVTHIEGAF